MCSFSDIDVDHPDEKSIMTYVAQFLQYSNDVPSADDDLEVRYLKQIVKPLYTQQPKTETGVWTNLQIVNGAGRLLSFEVLIHFHLTLNSSYHL